MSRFSPCRAVGISTLDGSGRLTRRLLLEWSVCGFRQVEDAEDMCARSVDVDRRTSGHALVLCRRRCGAVDRRAQHDDRGTGARRRCASPSLASVGSNGTGLSWFLIGVMIDRSVDVDREVTIPSPDFVVAERSRFEMMELMKAPGMRGAVVEAIVRKYRVPLLVTLVFATAGCGASKLTNHPDSSDANLQEIGSDRVSPESPNDLSLEAPAESPSDAALEVPAAEVSRDEKADAIDWNGTVDCLDMTCGAGEACTNYIGGEDGGPLSRRCVPALDACGAALDCSCLALGCFGGCTQVTARQFACGEGNAWNNDPNQFKVCPVPRRVSCFTGEICRSPQTDPTCAGGAWQCPSWSHATESCPPDSGTGDASDSGG